MVKVAIGILLKRVHLLFYRSYYYYTPTCLESSRNNITGAAVPSNRRLSTRTVLITMFVSLVSDMTTVKNEKPPEYSNDIFLNHFHKL